MPRLQGARPQATAYGLFRLRSMVSRHLKKKMFPATTVTAWVTRSFPTKRPSCVSIVILSIMCHRSGLPNPPTRSTAFVIRSFVMLGTPTHLRKEIKKHAAELHKKLMKNLRGASYRDMESRRRGEQQSGWVDFAAARLETEAPASDPPAPAPRAVEVTRPATTETTEDSTDAAKSEDGEAQQDADRPGPSTRSRTRRAAERQQNTQSTQTQTVLPVCRLDPGQLVQPSPPPPPREHTGQPAVTRTRRQARTVQATITTNTSSSTVTGITSSVPPTESGPRLMIRRSLIRPPAPRLTCPAMFIIVL